MCLHLGANTRLRIAEDDIVVYKHIIRGYALTLYTSYHWQLIEIGVTYDSSLVKKDYSVSEGLHSFVSIEDCRHFAEKYSEVLVECVIPAGSQYYVGSFCRRASIASNTLKYVKIIKEY